MQKVIRIDEQGFFIEDVLLEDGQDVPEDCTDVQVPEGFYLPRYVSGVWVEGKPQAEIDAIKNVIVPPTEAERISALEDAMMMLM